MSCIPPTIKTYPLYDLRRALLLTTPVTFFIAFVAVGNSSGYYGNGDAFPFMVHLFFAAVSALLGVFELIRWAASKSHDPDSDPRFPLKRVLIGDAILTVTFGIIFSTQVEIAGGYHDRLNILAAYASIVSLIGFVLHAMCAWKQMMALKKQNWEDGRSKRSGQSTDEVIDEDCYQRLKIYCPKCGVKISWLSVSQVLEDDYTPTSSQVENGLDVATGYEIIADKVSAIEAQSKSKKAKGKALSRSTISTPLMDV